MYLGMHVCTVCTWSCPSDTSFLSRRRFYYSNIWRAMIASFGLILRTFLKPQPSQQHSDAALTRAKCLCMQKWMRDVVGGCHSTCLIIFHAETNRTCDTSIDSLNR
jgi:hypothetical protein